MDFSVPKDLSKYSADAIRGLIEVARNEFSALSGQVKEAGVTAVTAEQLDDLEALKQFWYTDGPAAIEAQQAIADRFAAATEAPEVPVAVPAEPAVITPSVEDILDAGTAPTDTHTAVPEDVPVAYSAFIASAGVAGFEAGQKLTSMLDVTKAFMERAAANASMSARGTVVSVSPVAQLVRDYPDEFSMMEDSSDYPKLLALTDERNLPGGSLLAADKIARDKIRENPRPGQDAMVASAGWCAPSETDYSVCLQISTDGMWNGPEVQARRGGVRHNTGLDFSTIFGTCVSGGPYATGFFNLSEAEVESGVAKTCLEISCGSTTDTRLGVTGVCLTGNILANRGWPEYTEAFVRGAMAVSKHQINALQIAAIVAGSTAVTLTGNAPWATDGTVVSQVMSAVGLAVVDIKYALRAQQSSTFEVLMPFWILEQMRADWIRRNGRGSNREDLILADTEIAAGFAARGARVQYLYDWQDAFATCATSGSPGSSTPITSLPTSLDFVVYPAGTWVRAVQNVITLNSIYDSTKLVSNQVTQLFTEDGWAMLQMCTTSRVYTVDICPSGLTGGTHTVTC